MKIKLIVVGKTSKRYSIEGEKDYEKRLKHYCRFEQFIIPDIKNGAKLSQSELKNNEGKLILKQISSTDDGVNDSLFQDKTIKDFDEEALEIKFV